MEQQEEGEHEKDAFYVLKKGDLVGIYKSFSECQAQAASSLSDPTVSIFKGYGLSKEAEEFLASNGLKCATYSINASAVQANLFGKLDVCPFQQPPFKGKAMGGGSPPKTLKLVPQSDGVVGPRLVLPRVYQMKPESNAEPEPNPLCLPPSKGKVIDVDSAPKMSNVARQSDEMVQSHLRIPEVCQMIPETKATSISESCILEFDGASRGNPGPAGSGAVLRAEDGSVVYRLREGVGIATNNVAEYRALILGLKYALRKGFKHIRAQGDSNLVCMQVPGLWKVKHQNIAVLCKEARELKDKFSSFQIKHVYRDYNADADAQANLAINLKDGQVEEVEARSNT